MKPYERIWRHMKGNESKWRQMRTNEGQEGKWRQLKEMKAGVDK